MTDTVVVVLVGGGESYECVVCLTRGAAWLEK